MTTNSYGGGQGDYVNDPTTGIPKPNVTVIFSTAGSLATQIPTVPASIVSGSKGIYPAFTAEAGFTVFGSGDGGTTWFKVDAHSPEKLTWLNVLDFGAKVNGRFVTDAAMTSGSPTLSSNAAKFTAADVGKQIRVAYGNTVLSTTVQTFISTTQVTLAASPTGAVNNGYALLGTDDTTAVQAAIDAASAAGGGTVFIPTGICCLFGPQRTGSVAGTSGNAGQSFAYSGQLLMPARPQSVPEISINITGAAHPSGIAFLTVGNPAQPSGSTLASDSTTGNILDVVPDPAGFGYAVGAQSFIHVGVERLTAWTIAPTTACGGFSLVAACDASIEKVLITRGITGPTVTPAAGAVGLSLPGAQNGAKVRAQQVEIFGYGTGLTLSEHARLDDVYIQLCTIGVTVGDPAPHSTGPHSSSWAKVLLQRCATGITGFSQHYMAGEVEIEACTSWDIDDVNNQMVGELLVHNGSNGAGQATNLAVRNATNLNLRTKTNPSGWRSSTTVKDTLVRAARTTAVNTTTVGVASTTNQPWYSAGTMGADTTGALITGGNSYAFAPVQDRSASRILQATIKTSPTAASTLIGLVARQKVASGDGLAVYLVNAGGAGNAGVVITKGGGPYTTLASSTAAPIAANTTYTLAVVVQDSRLPGSLPTITAYLNGTSVVTYTLTAAEAAAYPATCFGGIMGYKGSGGDDGLSRITNFSDLPLA